MKRTRLSIKVAIGVTAGVSTIIAIMWMAHLSHGEFEEKIVSQTQNQLLTTARSTARMLEEFIQEHLQSLLILSNDPLVKEQVHNKVQSTEDDEFCRLGNLYEIHEDHTDTLFLTDSAGVVMDADPVKNDIVGTSLADRPDVAHMLTKQKPHIEVFYNDVGTLTISISRPIFYQDSFAGIVGWTIESNTLCQRFVEQIKIADYGYAWMFDNKNTVLSHPRRDFIGMSVLDVIRKTHKERGESFNGSRAKEHIREEHNYLNRVKSQNEGYGIFANCVTDENDIIAYKKISIGETSFNLITSLPYSQIVGPIQEHAINTFGVAAVIILLLGCGGVALLRSEKKKSKLKAERKHLKQIAESAEALKESEQRLSGIVDSVTDAMIMVDEQFNIAWANDIAKTMLAPDMVGKKCYKIYHGRDEICEPCIVKQCFEDGMVHEFETEICGTDGNRMNFWCKASVAERHQGGRPKMVVEFLRDITQRKQAEEALEESVRRVQVAYDQSVVYAQHLNEEIEGRKRAQAAVIQAKEDWENTFDAITDMVMLLDNEHHIIRVNSAAAQALNTTKENLVGKKCYEAIHDKSRPIRRCPLVHTMKTIDAHTTEIAEPNLGGIFICSTSPILNLEGKLTGYTHTLKDITESKRLEAQLQQAQKMEAIGALAGGVAHDLNNILSGIVSYPDLLLMQIPEGSPLRQPIKTMKESGKKAADIVQDLLTLTRRGVATTELTNLNEIISEYLKSPEHQKLKLYHSEVEVETALETDLLHILGSPVHLSKTVMNLVSNAAEAMPDGGRVLILTDNRYIDRPVRGHDDIEEGDYVTLTVSDSGVGIPSEDLRRVFEPFYTKKKMGRSGTGLGMAVVWGTVKDHKGYIDIQSTEGQGTSVTLYFPATRQQPVKDQAGLYIEDYRGSGQSILVVDDVKEQREIAFTILSELGYSVTSVASGEEAVEYVKDNSVDLLVLDMIMDPNIDGLDTYKQILELHPGQKAIIASGFSETDRVKEAQNLGAGQYIKKPYTLKKMGMVVKAEIEK